MRTLMSTIAASAALAGSLVGAHPAQAAASDAGQLRNKDTGLCVERQDPADRPLAVFMAECDGGAKQQWVYSAAAETIRTPGTGLCLSTSSTSTIAAGACDSGLLVHWRFSADGRIHQVDWGIGCVEDYRTQYLTWGACTNETNEVWSLAAA
ncbi:ricin-type beta-trefoil lectin domain protein [Actinoplanes sp. NPDC049265]|uniref:ricin-type beta-trefoil lectin domain protein n=1 Tax=Actinoplanes sp. NPDC049265 TaxID=3363902 RepID=UPI0037190EB6